MRRHQLTIAIAALAAAPLAANGQSRAPERAASSSLMEQAIQARSQDPQVDGSAFAAQATSLFHVPTPEDRVFRKHDLVQIIIRESAKSRSKHKLRADKEIGVGAKFDGTIFDEPINETDLRLLLTKVFEGDAKYERDDDLTARVTAEVVQVLPNGNLVLEGRTTIVQDLEEKVISITGICRSADVTTLNTVLSSQVHDLRITTNHEGELRSANERGILAKIFDFIFAW